MNKDHTHTDGDFGASQSKKFRLCLAVCAVVVGGGGGGSLYMMMMLPDDGGGHGSGIDDHEVQGRDRSAHGEFEFPDCS